MLQDSHGKDAVVTCALWNFLQTGVHTAHAQSMRAIPQEFLERFDGVAGARHRKVRNVIEIAGPDFQEIATCNPLRNSPVHPGLELNHNSRQPFLPGAIGPVVFHITGLVFGG